LGRPRRYTGGRARDNNLIDEVGDERQAIEWLRGQEGVSEDLPVIDYEPDSYDGIFGGVMSWAGFDGLMESRLGLDGLLALWQPM
jgi:ClpP class serine protease